MKINKQKIKKVLEDKTVNDDTKEIIRSCIDKPKYLNKAYRYWLTSKTLLSFREYLDQYDKEPCTDTPESVDGHFIASYSVRGFGVSVSVESPNTNGIYPIDIHICRKYNGLGIMSYTTYSSDRFIKQYLNALIQLLHGT